MERKSLLQLSAVVLAVFAAVVLVACGSGVNAGFANQQALARAHVNVAAKMELAEYGEGPSYNELMQFAPEGKIAVMGMSLGGEIGKFIKGVSEESMKSARAHHKAMMDGKVVEKYKEDGTVDKYVDNTQYKKDYADAKSTSRSFKFISADKNVELTKTASNGGHNRATHVEVWNVKYEFTPHTAGVAGTKKEETTQIPIIKIGDKWYATEFSMPGMSSLGGLLS